MFTFFSPLFFWYCHLSFAVWFVRWNRTRLVRVVGKKSHQIKRTMNFEGTQWKTYVVQRNKSNALENTWICVRKKWVSMTVVLSEKKGWFLRRELALVLGEKKIHDQPKNVTTARTKSLSNQKRSYADIVSSSSQISFDFRFFLDFFSFSFI